MLRAYQTGPRIQLAGCEPWNQHTSDSTRRVHAISARRLRTMESTRRRDSTRREHNNAMAVVWIRDGIPKPLIDEIWSDNIDLVRAKVARVRRRRRSGAKKSWRIPQGDLSLHEALRLVRIANWRFQSSVQRGWRNSRAKEDDKHTRRSESTKLFHESEWKIFDISLACYTRWRPGGRSESMATRRGKQRWGAQVNHTD
jgi:hypothetical protein